MADGPFLLPRQPAADDRRPRNAFGYLASFGVAYKAYHDALAAGATRDEASEASRRATEAIDGTQPKDTGR